ncbi:hypothetical protein LINPERHAP1_LOCUS26532 [Linum perenne]
MWLPARASYEDNLDKHMIAALKDFNTNAYNWLLGHQAWKQSGRVAIKAPHLNIDQSKERGKCTTKRKKG